MYQVLKPGGHFCVSDIVPAGELPERFRSVVEMYTGCVTGATWKNRNAMFERIKADRIPGILVYNGDIPIGWFSVAAR